MNRKILCALWLYGLLCSVGHADVIFKIEDVVVTPGSQAVVGVFVHATAGEALVGFNLPVEIGGNGRGFPAGLIGFTAGNIVQVVNSLSGTVDAGIGSLPVEFVQDYEVTFRDEGPARTLPTADAPLRLFNFRVDTSTEFTGTVPVSITHTTSTVNLLSISTSAGSLVVPTAPGGGLQLLGGSITAVPEPSAWSLLGLLAGLTGHRRRR